MKIVEYIPEIIPIINASAKSFMLPEVKIKRDITASNVVTVVIIVLLKISV